MVTPRSEHTPRRLSVTATPTTLTSLTLRLPDSILDLSPLWVTEVSPACAQFSLCSGHALTVLPIAGLSDLGGAFYSGPLATPWARPQP